MNYGFPILRNAAGFFMGSSISKDCKLAQSSVRHFPKRPCKEFHFCSKMHFNLILKNYPPIKSHQSNVFPTQHLIFHFCIIQQFVLTDYSSADTVCLSDTLWVFGVCLKCKLINATIQSLQLVKCIDLE